MEGGMMELGWRWGKGIWRGDGRYGARKQDGSGIEV